jgi:hypothetical protein
LRPLSVINNTPVLDHCAERSGFSREQRRSSSDLDLLADFTDFQGEVNTRYSADLQIDILALRGFESEFSTRTL